MIPFFLAPARAVLPDPYCAECGQSLKGAIDSAVCPECGRPLVEVLIRGNANYAIGQRYESLTKIGSLPLIAMALGRDADGKPGHAKGFIALGDKATGVIAVGGIARGVIAIGGVSVGICTMGGVSIGTLSAVGGIACAPLGFSLGGLSIGGIAQGGLAVGFIAQGGLALGWAARGGEAFGQYVWSMSSTSQTSDATLALFRDHLDLFLGSGAAFSVRTGTMWLFAVTLQVLFLIVIYATLRYKKAPAQVEEGGTRA